MRAVLLLTLIALSGCDLNPLYRPDGGEFSATVRGASDLDIRGEANSFLHTAADPVYFDINLRRSGVDYAGSIDFRVETDVRAVGTYSIGPDASQMHVVYDVDSRTDQEFVATSGELTIREVQETDLLGSFTFEAVDASGEVVMVEGIYRARRIAYPGPE